MERYTGLYDHAASSTLAVISHSSLGSLTPAEFAQRMTSTVQQAAIF
jgi:hypothetical protein